jgi:hypothetical protein
MSTSKAVTLEIETIHPDPIHWVGIATFSGEGAFTSARDYGNMLVKGLSLPPLLRIIDSKTREVLISGWMLK